MMFFSSCRSFGLSKASLHSSVSGMPMGVMSVRVKVGGQFLGRVVDEVAAGQEFPVILQQGLAVDGDHQVVAAPPAEIAVFADPNLIPGGQALDIGREDVLRADRYPQPKDGLGEKVVGAGRTGAVDVGKADDEVVDPFYLVHFFSHPPLANCR